MEQDWKPAVLGRSGAKPKQHVAPTDGGSSSGTGERKFDGGRNIQHQTAVYARKLDEDDEARPLENVGRTVGQRIQQVRQEKGWTQKQLAQAISEKPSIINDYEQGRGVQNQQILSKIERALGGRVRPEKPRKGKKK